MNRLLAEAARGGRLDDEAVLALEPLPAGADLYAVSAALALEGFGTSVGFSRKVFIPLTHLCRDVCHYCTFARVPDSGAPYLSIEQVLEIARAGRAAGCHEALFTLGDRPERRYRAARDALAALGAVDTLDYLARAARAVLDEVGLLPHLNPGLLDDASLARLRPVAASMGLMLESVSQRLCERGGPHFGSPDKRPERRLATLESAGRQRVAFTTGLLVGIGETRRERLETLLAIRRQHAVHGHVQEVIVQNFRAKPGTKMAAAPEPPLDEHLWTIAMARLVLGPGVSIQAPPNLRPSALPALIRAGINDWGGVSPVTPDHVNPEAPWPHLDALATATRAAGRELVERLALVPGFCADAGRWTTPEIATRIRERTDSRGLVRADDWRAGRSVVPPSRGTKLSPGVADRRTLADRALEGREWSSGEIEALFRREGEALDAVLGAADDVRRHAVGDVVTFVVNRNINYTNICTYRCTFCAYSKGRSSRSLRGAAYRLDLDTIAARAREAFARGATEVCLQGGIHPGYTGETYLEIVRAVRAAVPSIHIHAFSPLEIHHGASTLALSHRDFLRQLRESGLNTLPGTAAEILDDEVREILCPDKLTARDWLSVVSTAHEEGLRTTATIMFGHVDQPRHWAEHLLQIRGVQCRTGGFTEFVPLPFVAHEAPLYRRGLARPGPTFREALLMHAVARLVLYPVIGHVQASWVKLGTAGAAAALRAGADDLGGTLMDESITRAAGGAHGQALGREDFEAIALRAGRPLRQRNTCYGTPDPAGMHDVPASVAGSAAPAGRAAAN